MLSKLRLGTYYLPEKITGNLKLIEKCPKVSFLPVRWAIYSNDIFLVKPLFLNLNLSGTLLCK